MKKQKMNKEKRRYDKICLECGKKFNTIYSFKKYCSPLCADDASRKRIYAYAKENRRRAIEQRLAKLRRSRREIV